MKDMKRKNWYVYGFGWFLLGAAFIALITYVLMILWNWLIPALFVNGVEITFIQAFGILVLTKILTGFSSWGRHGWRGRYCGDGYSSHRGYWKQRWEQKIANMTPEEREKFKQAYYERCGRGKHWMWRDEEKNDTTTGENKQ